MQFKKLCKAMAVLLTLSITVPNIAMAAQSTDAGLKRDQAVSEASSKEETGNKAGTETPATETPATEAPDTETPATEAPTTEAPATETPDTEVPATEVPATEEPQTDPLPTEKPTDPKEGKKPKDPKDDGTDRKHNKGDKDDDEKAKNYVPDERFTTVVDPEKVPTSFRYKTVKKEYALVKEKEAKVYGEPKAEAVEVGTLKKDNLCFILKKVDETWSYIESGSVRGFVKSEVLESGENVKKAVIKKGEKKYSTGRALVETQDNPAWTYLQVTTGATLEVKNYAIADTDNLNIREEQNQDSRKIGKMQKGTLCYVLADEDADWVFVESGDVRGFVKSEYLIQGKEARELVEEKDVEKMGLAKELIKPEENKACYYTLTSTTQPAESNLELLGEFTLTAYCSCPICCGQWSGGMCAGGVYPVQGRTIAMGGVEFGTKLVINGEVYTVEDRGTPYGHVDIYMVHHGEAAVFGKQAAEVYLLNDENSQQDVDLAKAE